MSVAGFVAAKKFAFVFEFVELTVKRAAPATD
jgi:hypothetical protein